MPTINGRVATTFRKKVQENWGGGRPAKSDHCYLCQGEEYEGDTGGLRSFKLKGDEDSWSKGEIVDICRGCYDKLKTKGKLNEMADDQLVKDWMKRNKSVLEPRDLIKQAQSRFDITKEKAILLFHQAQTYKAVMENMFKEAELVSQTVWQGVEKKKYKLDPDEEDDLEKFLIAVSKEIPAAMQAKQMGKFSKLGMLVDIAKWYEEKGYVTEKQLAILKKNALDKISDPAFIKKHLKDLGETEGDAWEGMA